MDIIQVFLASLTSSAIPLDQRRAISPFRFPPERASPPRRAANPRYADPEAAASEYRVYDEVVPYAVRPRRHDIFCCSVVLCILLAESGGPSLARVPRVSPGESGGWLIDRRCETRVARGRGGCSPHSLVRETAETPRNGRWSRARRVRLARNKADATVTEGRAGPRPLPGAMRPKRCHDRLCQRARRSGACKLQILRESGSRAGSRSIY